MLLPKAQGLPMTWDTQKTGEDGPSDLRMMAEGPGVSLTPGPTAQDAPSATVLPDAAESRRPKASPSAAMSSSHTWPASHGALVAHSRDHYSRRLSMHEGLLRRASRWVRMSGRKVAQVPQRARNRRGLHVPEASLFLGKEGNTNCYTC